jgi:predicted CxxxxCH...CXXCH cytochrome family protein
MRNRIRRSAAGLAVLVGATAALVSLAHCGEQRPVPRVAATSEANACANCHGTPSLGGAPPPTHSGATGTEVMEVGAHVAHLTGGRITGPVACTECHVVPQDVAEPGHMDASRPKVVFGPLASTGGTATWNRDEGTCAVYCHGATLAAGGTATTPLWNRVDGTQVLCGSCHGAPPPPPHPQVAGCAACHPATVRPDNSLIVDGGAHVNGRVDVFATHPPGWLAPEVHGLAAKDDLDSCQTCHGESFAGGTGPSCNDCHGGPQWQTNCTFCHGDRVSGVPAPPRGPRNETSTSDPAVGAHTTHVTASGLARAFSCDVCHAVPTNLAHIDGDPSPRFGTLARTAGSTPTWDPATLSCATTYCHGGTLRGGSNTTPVWTRVDGTQAACGTCHSAPPPAPHPQATNCGACHEGYSLTTVNAVLHVDGTVQVAPTACGQCHSIPPPSPHVQSQSCGNCHPGYSSTTIVTRTHLDGQVQANAGACGSCHTIPPSPPHPQLQTCGTCHAGYDAANANPATHMDGRVQATVTCGSCHAIPPPPPHIQSQRCGDCHPGYSPTAANEATHMDGRVQVNATCGSCHAIPPPSPHPQLATCGTCHPGYGPSTANPATHMDGQVQANVACGSCHAIPPPSPHPAVTDCGGCHPGYSSSSVNAATHADGQVQATMDCRACHGQPPSSGSHEDHDEEGISCATCHAGFTTSRAGPGHMNGVVNVTAPGWNPGSKTCANSCHGTERWGD